MDQVKVVLKVMGKYHFWIVAGIVAIVALVIYTSASGNLASQFEEGQARIDGKAEAASRIVSGGPPDNQNVIDAFVDDVGKAKEDVLDAWEFLYKLQKEKNPWPAELGKETLLVINSLGPDDEIPVRYREIYRDFINNHFPALWDIIDVRREVLKDPQTGKVVLEVFDFADPNPWGTYKERVEQGYYKQEIVGKVVWSAPEVLALGADWVSVPSTKQVRLAQEDLWVYEALLRIVRKTNEGSTSYHNAAIKRIDAMNIGPAGSAAFASKSGEVSASPTMSGASESYDEYGGSEMSDGGGGGFYATAGMNSDEALLQGRYVDLQWQPLSADATPPFAEFKMMPVRMIFLMDQRRIPDLLTNCANSSMPVEVVKVSIRPGEGGPLDVGTMASAGDAYLSGGDEYGGGDEYSGGGDEYGGSGGQGRSMASQPVVGGILPDSMDVPVEIRGVIFIFNPPDREKLGTGSAGEEPDENAAPLVPQRAPTVSSPNGPAAPAADGGEAVGTPATPDATPAEPAAAAPPAAGGAAPAN